MATYRENIRVDRLKKLGEFDNKIFIVVADHGHTAMPKSSDMTYVQTKKDENGNVIGQKTWYGYDKGELKIEEFNKAEIKYPEIANNNLHIWELAEVMRNIGNRQNATIRSQYKVLVPSEIAETFKDKAVPAEYRPVTETDETDVIAALNGPMAHIYSKAGMDEKTIGEIAEILRLMIGGYHPTEAIKWLGFHDEYEYMEFQMRSVKRLWNSIDKILIRKEDGKYGIFNGLDDHGKPLTAELNTLSELEYIDAEKRINGLNNPNRSGDIVLIMRDKISDNEENRYSSGVSYKSWHGSLNRTDSYVPFIISYAGGNKKEIGEMLRRDTLCMQDYSNCKDNWKLPDIVKEIINEQFR